MGMIPSNLCILIEQLEDARQFHELAAEVSDGGQHQLHHEQAQGYAAMLSEIRRWESRASECDESTGSSVTWKGLGHADPVESYAALLDRVYRIHLAVAPDKTSIRIRAAVDTTDGQARDGLRRAG